jgi:hypothetical protein
MPLWVDAIFLVIGAALVFGAVGSYRQEKTVFDRLSRLWPGSERWQGSQNEYWQSQKFFLGFAMICGFVIAILFWR